MSKKILSVVLALVLCILSLFAVSCGNGKTGGDGTGEGTGAQQGGNKVKVGFIFLHDQNSTYDKNFMDAAEAACKAAGLSEDQYIFRVNVPEGNECKVAAEDLVDQGCNLIFADSFGHEEFILAVAKEHPEVQFCHATGTMAHTEKLANFHNAFASIYEGRYLAGVVAGMKLNEMIEDGTIKADEAKIGYVGAWPYAEVISGFTSFFLGARSVCASATMEVNFTSSWFDVNAERDMANALMDHGCKLISQHADSMGAPSACEERGVPNVSYNGSTLESCPNTFLVSSRIDWQPYFEYIIGAMKNGTAIDTDWTGTLKNGSVKLTELNTSAVAEGTAAKLEEVRTALENGSLHVFDTSKFTVGGQTLTEYMADVDTDAAFTPDTNVISDGYFHESEKRSAPYFDIIIDGITRLDQNG